MANLTPIPPLELAFLLAQMQQTGRPVAYYTHAGPMGLGTKMVWITYRYNDPKVVETFAENYLDPKEVEEWPGYRVYEVKFDD